MIISFLEVEVTWELEKPVNEGKGEDQAENSNNGTSVNTVVPFVMNEHEIAFDFTVNRTEGFVAPSKPSWQISQFYVR